MKEIICEQMQELSILFLIKTGLILNEQTQACKSFFLKKSQLFLLKYICTTTIHLSFFCRNLNTLITNLITYFGQVSDGFSLQESLSSKTAYK